MFLDDDVYEKYINIKFYIANGYACFFGNGKRTFLHRVINKTPKNKQTDHIDGNRLNNQRENLRSVTSKQNMWNKKIHKNNKVGYKGVFLRKRKTGNKYIANITKDKKFYWIGTFNTPEEASRAFNTKAKELCGEYAFNNI